VNSLKFEVNPKIITLYSLILLMLSLLIQIHPTLTESTSNQVIPVNFQLSVNPDSRFAPVNVVDGVGLASVKIDFESDSELWEILRLEICNITDPELEVSEIKVPVNLALSDIQTDINIDLPSQLMMPLHLEGDKVIGSYETEMRVTGNNAPGGFYDVWVNATVEIPEISVPPAYHKFQINVQPRVTQVPGFSFASIILGVLLAVIVILVTYETTDFSTTLNKKPVISTRSY
jgi:hypothetical protein